MPDDREALGRANYEAQAAWQQEQPTEMYWCSRAWEALGDGEREPFMRGASAVAAQAVADAGLEVAALEMARRKLVRIAALCRDAKASAELGSVPGVNADLLLALIGNDGGTGDG
jgi:hypothetical protein